MISLAWILLLATPALANAAPARINLVDEVYRIPPDEWRYVEVGLNQRPALVAADYEVQSGPKHVRLILMRREDMELLRAGEPHGMLAATAEGPSGKLRFHVRTPGNFALVVDNRGSSQPARVFLRVSLDFSGRRSAEATFLSRRRQFTVILLSFLVFFAIVIYSARRLLRAIKH
ncbi:MAG TPA: hypothetical protein VG675_14035 [Bryobacteraceae bacterium]|nr:hypothetical protein [Bryobacteraceae bacterium]